MNIIAKKPIWDEECTTAILNKLHRTRNNIPIGIFLDKEYSGTTDHLILNPFEMSHPIGYLTSIGDDFAHVKLTNRGILNTYENEDPERENYNLRLWIKKYPNKKNKLPEIIVIFLVHDKYFESLNAFIYKNIDNMKDNYII